MWKTIKQTARVTILILSLTVFGLALLTIPDAIPVAVERARWMHEILEYIDRDPLKWFFLVVGLVGITIVSLWSRIGGLWARLIATKNQRKQLYLIRQPESLCDQNWGDEWVIFPYSKTNDQPEFIVITEAQRREFVKKGRIRGITTSPSFFQRVIGRPRTQNTGTNSPISHT